jgi:hypothetical protein
MEIDDRSLFEIIDTNRRFSNPVTYFLFVMRMTFRMWKFYFNKDQALKDLYFKREVGAKVHGPNDWKKSELQNHLEEEFLDILGWGDMYEQKR